ncbi:MAG: triphosphoribosyl-dephospho-CoA synthase [Gammaproteobacteria bacterium]
MSLQQLVLASFHGDTAALKPGNVSVYADGHDMTVADFQRSAEVATPFICHRDWRYGQRLYAATEATMEAVGCNTNLGMLLLFIPLVMAAEKGFSTSTGLRESVRRVLADMNQQDAVDMFAAIRLAQPGGLGKVEQHDVNEVATCTVLEAMKLASHRDSVALQYINHYEQVFEQGLPTIRGFVHSWNSVEWATVACHMEFLASLPDSHIVRKHGEQVAEQIKKQSGAIKDTFTKYNNPQAAKDLLLDFDERLKLKKINPGTTADLTTTSLLVYNLAHDQEH